MVTAGVAVASVLAAPVAFADSSDTLYTTWPDRRAHAQFKSYDETVTVWDDEKDGSSAVVYLQVEGYNGPIPAPGPDAYRCVNSKGSGTSRTCDYEFAENRDVKWSLNVEDLDGGGGGTYAGSPQYDHT